jgi:YcaO-like protein with predicted kinase domain
MGPADVAGAPLNGAASIRPGDRKTFWEGTHRVCPPQETVGRLAPYLSSLGVTRVANVTGLDYLGIPVVMSVRPNSYNLSVYQGKGVSLEAARAGAVMEAYEYACAEEPRADAIWSTASALNRRIVPRNLLRKWLRSDIEIPWVVGTDLLTGRTVLVPEETVSTDFRRPIRAGFGMFDTTSNGLASGNTQDEATLHAMCELIERDALTLWKLSPATVRAETWIDPRHSDDASIQALMDKYDAAAMRVELWEITSDLEVPAFFCVIDDADGEPPFLGRFGGAGCHPDVQIAMCRALTEAAQSRLTFIVGSRDDIPFDSYTLTGWDRSIANLIAGQQQPPASGSGPHSDSIGTDTITADVDAVLARLSAGGINNIARVDLARSEIGVPCVRVLIPDLEGASHWKGYRAGKRALKTMQKVA